MDGGNREDFAHDSWGGELEDSERVVDSTVDKGPPPLPSVPVRLLSRLLQAAVADHDYFLNYDTFEKVNSVGSYQFVGLYLGGGLSDGVSAYIFVKSNIVGRHHLASRMESHCYYTNHYHHSVLQDIK